MFLINEVLNKSLGSGQLAVQRIGAGRAITGMHELSPAEVYLLAAPDAQLNKLCRELQAAAVLRSGDVVFHCSGALSAAVLSSARKSGAKLASVHPIKTFLAADEPADLTAVHCAIEGDAAALAILKPAFAALGGQLFALTADAKLIYHAAAVFACNYLTALLEVSAQAYEQAGLERQTALQAMQPLVNQTLENVFKNGTDKALTGPIARGEVQIIAQQLQALNEWNADYGALYKQLGAVALTLAQSQNRLTPTTLNAIAALLKKN